MDTKIIFISDDAALLYEAIANVKDKISIIMYENLTSELQIGTQHFNCDLIHSIILVDDKIFIIQNEPDIIHDINNFISLNNIQVNKLIFNKPEIEQKNMKDNIRIIMDKKVFFDENSELYINLPSYLNINYFNSNDEQQTLLEFQFRGVIKSNNEIKLLRNDLFRDLDKDLFKEVIEQGEPEVKTIKQKVKSLQ